MADTGDKTHDATPYRRQQAREQGQVTRSQDLASALVLCAATLILYYFCRDICEFLLGLSHAQLAFLPAGPYGISDAAGQLRALGWGAAAVTLPILILVFAASVFAQVMQVGFLFLPQKLAFDWSHISPLQGFRRLFSVANVMRLAFGLMKVGVVATVAGWYLWSRFDEILAATALPMFELAAFLLQTMFGTTIRIGATLLVLAILDYGYQYYRHERDLRMTDQEIRDELKTLQGDPQVAARRRAVQRQLVTSRLNSLVPTADFVVTNPTELAVAVRYDFESMPAPVVVAKGAGVLAQRIRRLALEHHIPIIERKEVARALYQQVEVNQPIPSEQYAAVAEILRYVYQLKGKTLPKVA